MKRVLRVFKHKGEEYENILERRTDGIFILKDFNGHVPFSPFYYCVGDLGFIDINKIEASIYQPMLNYLISQSEDGAHYWADNKHAILGYITN